MEIYFAQLRQWQSPLSRLFDSGGTCIPVGNPEKRVLRRRTERMRVRVPRCAPFYLGWRKMADSRWGFNSPPGECAELEGHAKKRKGQRDFLRCQGGRYRGRMAFALRCRATDLIANFAFATTRRRTPVDWTLNCTVPRREIRRTGDTVKYQESTLVRVRAPRPGPFQKHRLALSLGLRGGSSTSRRDGCSGLLRHGT